MAQMLHCIHKFMNDRTNNKTESGGKMANKSMVLVLVGVLVAALFITATVQNAASVIALGRHDLSAASGSAYKYDDASETCIFCHTPHGGNKNQRYDTDPTVDSDTSGTLNGQYLWNRRIPNHTWTPYGSGTMNAAPGNPGTLSLLCLSCHDGIGAMNVLLNYSATGQPSGTSMLNQFGEMLGDPAIDPLNIGGGGPCAGYACAGGTGGDLQNDHPIGFNYDAALIASDGGLQDYASLPAAIQKRLDLTPARSMECSTCHDPHITNTAPVGNKFLVMSNVGSALCLGCHLK